MPFIPHSEADTAAMLAAIGAKRIEDLFDEIPAALRAGVLGGIPEGLNEQGVSRLMRQRAATDGTPLNFAGAGSYEHHIPAAVWEITTRGEFYSAYTPYQAEASQGTLQLIYEFQTMMTRLTGMDVSNASMYDGATALAEAVLMAERTRKKPVRRVLIPRSVHPLYRKVVKTIVEFQDIEVVEIPFDAKTGRVDPAALAQFDTGGDFSALVIPQPNYFGVLEEVDALTEWAHSKGALAIAVVNPMTLGILKSPGTWGGRGVDICCGDGQPLGVPMSSGGPYFGFLTCKKEIVRQMPGRIVGRTTDLDGREGFALTLQAREQHIRRAKATSNICTNQGLLVTAATIYMSLVGPEGLKRVAALSASNTRALVAKLAGIAGIKQRFATSYFHEAVFDAPKPAREIIERLAGSKILAGVSLGADYPEIGDALLVCATETKTEEDLEIFAKELARALA